MSRLANGACAGTKGSRERAYDECCKKEETSDGWLGGRHHPRLLELSEEESAYIDIKLRLASKLSNRRRSIGITQVAMAKKIGSSQSRVAKMEAGDPSVTIDLLVRSLIAVGEKTLFADDR
ncbi:MAG: helix-turn-helix transcriptional regulator [Spirochaetia bacterium]